MARAIDGDELLGIERLLDTDVVRKSKTASWLLDQVLHDIQSMPTLAPAKQNDESSGSAKITTIRFMTEYEYMILSRMAARATYNVAHVRPEASAEERKALKEKASVLNAACHICAKYIKREVDNGK